MRATRLGIAGVLLAACLAAASSVSDAPAQAPKKAVRPDTAREGQFRDLFDGNKPVVDPGSKAGTDSNRQAIAAIAEWLAFRLAEPSAVSEETKGKSTHITYMVNDASRYLLFPRDGTGRPKKLTDGQTAFVNEMGAAMVKSLRELYKSDVRPIVKVNAGMVMAAVGSTGYEGVADWALEVLGNAGEPAYNQVYALETLRNLLAVRNPSNPERPAIASPKRLAAVVKALEARVLAKPTVVVPPAGSPEAEGRAGKDAVEELEVFVALRAKAVEALSALPIGVIRDDLNKAVARPGHTLLMVAVSDQAINPAPTPRERVDAFCGFCAMVPDDRLVVDYATYGLVLSALDLIRDHTAGNRALPWRITAGRVREAGGRYKAGTAKARLDKAELAAEFDRIVNEVMAPIADKGAEGQPEPAKLNQWRQERTMAAVPSVYADDKATVLTPRAPGN